MKARIPKPTRHINVTQYESWYIKKRYGVQFDFELDCEYPIDKFDGAVEKFFDFVQSVVNVTINSWYTRLPRKPRIRVEPHDTWSADMTIATLVVPILEQLREVSHGTPILVNEDEFPDHLKLVGDETPDSLPDEKRIARWDYLLSEMIYAFTRIRDDDVDEQFITYVGGNEKDKYEWLTNHHFDREGYDAEMARIQNGLNLFGKYFTALWD